MALEKSGVVENGITSRVCLFTVEECLQITDWVIRYGDGSPGLVHARGDASKTSLRRCKEYIIDPAKIVFDGGITLAERVWDGFVNANIWGLEFSSVPSIRVMEYQPRDGYGAHTDWSNGAARERKISMTCQLSDGEHYDGGNVCLYAGPDLETISRDRGTATFWPSWTLHEVRPVVRGVRFALTAWAHGTPYR